MHNRICEQAVKSYFTLFAAAKCQLDRRLSPIGRRLAQAVEQRAAEVRKRWEESDYVADNPLHRLRGQTLIWLFSVGRKLRQPDTPIRTYCVPIAFAFSGITLGLVFGMILHLAALQILLAAVFISVRTGGLRAGLLTTLFCCVSVAFMVRNTFHTPAGMGTLAALVCFLFVSVLACVLVDSLETVRQDTDRRLSSAEAVARRFRLLAETTAMLEAEFSYEGILASVTRAIVPACAHWSTAEVFRDGQLRRVALAHQDDAVAASLGTVQRNRALSIPDNHPLYGVLLARQARIFPDVTEALLEPLQLDHQNARGLKPAHLLFVPLTARNQLLGALTFISTKPDCPFSPADLVVACDLALRAGTAMDNVRLYDEAREEAAEHARREHEATEQSCQIEQQRLTLELHNARLTVAARTDGLTGLLNHLTFQREIQTEYMRAQSVRAPLSLAILDVDHFKDYNDTFGHPAGDEVLRRIAATLQESARSTDLVARYGGEEFVVVMPDTDALGAFEATERLCRSVESAAGHRRPVTASFGIATITDTMSGARELIALADQALYRSKQQGRNRVTHANWMPEAVVYGRDPSAVIPI